MHQSSLFVNYALSISVAAGLLAACGGSQPPINMDASRMQNTRNVSAVSNRMGKPTSYRVVYSFAKSGDGSGPVASLIDVNGTLYGTTEYGGTSDSDWGTVFSVTTSGKETVLHSFGTSKDDGDGPYAGLVDLNGTLYGTTISGGAYCCGTVFSITTGGNERVVHSFSNSHEGGSTLTAGLIDVDGTLYGTTKRGSYTEHHCGCGTVFSLTTGGRVKVLRSFGKGDNGYWLPAGLIDVNDVLYGTTFAGGANGRGGSSGEQVGGVVFSMTMDGKEKVLHAFGKGADGLGAEASLIDVDGTLYGTTEYGGTHNHGTVFSITPSGEEKVIYSFGDVPDGATPQAGLVDVGGTLYGTTSGGGAYRYSGISGGTVFSVTTGGKEKVLHSFGKGNDGYIPLAGLLDVKGTLYGTTSGGGKYHGGSSGYGTVFALNP
jgi:uncharacterized repeat protein (TIGR03803 family)